MDDKTEKIQGRAMVIAYPMHESLYLNITNRCTNACRFCIRETPTGVGYNLWLENEPTVAEITAAVGDPTRYREIVFCGYGEPLIRPEVVVAVSRHLKKFPVNIRLNTNGLADLFLDHDILPQLKGLIDIISISLNAHDGKTYQELTQTGYGEAAYEAVIDFVRRSLLHIPKVIVTAVRYPGVDLQKVALIAQKLGVELRVREFLE